MQKNQPDSSIHSEVHNSMPSFDHNHPRIIKVILNLILKKF